MSNESKQMPVWARRIAARLDALEAKITARKNGNHVYELPHGKSQLATGDSVDVHNFFRGKTYAEAMKAYRASGRDN